MKDRNERNDRGMKDLSELIAMKSIYGSPAPHAPFGEENRSALEKFLSLARGYGLKTGEDDGYAAWAEIGESGPLIGILAHLDVVPAGEGWDSDPWTLTVRDGVMFGRGVSDDKGPLVACLQALASLKSEENRLGARVRLIVGCNEENGSECIKHYAKHREIPVASFTPDSDFPVVASEKGILHLALHFPASDVHELFEIRSGERANIVPCEAVCRFASPEVFARARRAASSRPADFTTDGNMTLTAHGKAAHGSMPERGDNAAVKLLGLLGGLTDTPVVRWANAYLADSAPERLGIAYADESGALTVNLGICEIAGGNADLTLDLRVPACAEQAQVISAVEATLPDGARLEVLHASAALMFAEDDPLVATLLKVYREATGDSGSMPLHIGGGTYAKELPNCVAFGAVFPGQDTHMHEPNERYPVADFERLIDIYTRAVRALCALYRE